MTVLLFLSILLVLGMIAAATWLVGLWNNVITWISLVLSGLVASSFFEPLADRLHESASESAYLVDFLAVWAIFVATFAVLRIATGFLSRYRLQFDPWTEVVGRSVLSAMIALTFFAFASFTLHTAPLPIRGTWGDHFQPTANARSFGVGADRVWSNFVQAASRGSLSEFRESRFLYPYDLPSSTSVREFDPAHEFIARYRQRRRMLSEQDHIQVANPDAK
jgi:hypothetical protein